MRVRSIATFLAGGLLAMAPAFAEQAATKPAGKVFAHIATSEGTFTVELFEKEAPKTVANFIGLAQGTKEWTDPRTQTKVKKPYYDGLIFHRVIADFMIQAGDPLGNGTGGPGYSFADELTSGRKFDKPGILAMANRGPNTNGAQFFVTLAPYPSLNGKYTIFGEVVDGVEVVNKIGVTPTNKADNKPLKPIVIRSVKIERKAE